MRADSCFNRHASAANPQATYALGVMGFVQDSDWSTCVLSVIYVYGLLVLAAAACARFNAVT